MFTKAINNRLESWCEELPSSLKDIGKYALLNGGHRIRPNLCLAWCLRNNGKIEDAIDLAAAVELVHTVSLIQDDMPCMDNTQYRRKKESVWLKYGEQAAILISDIMLAGAFKLAGRSPSTINELTSAIVSMSTGQYLEPYSIDWETINAQKTAALFQAACGLGVLAANGSEEELKLAHDYGYNFGMAYQLFDDIADNDGALAQLDATAARGGARIYLSNCSALDSSLTKSIISEFPE